MKKQFRLLLVIVFIFGFVNLWSQFYFNENFEGTWSGTPSVPSGWTGFDGAGATNRYFEKATYIGGGWTPAGNGTKPAGAMDGTAAAHYNDYNATANQVDELQTPTINLSTSSNPRINFYYAYPYTSWSGSLKLMGWNGSVWSEIATYNCTGSVTTWTQVKIPIPSMYKIPGARFSFKVTAGYGSADLWLDKVIVEEGPAPLAGVYYINPAGGSRTYISFTNAINALNEAGISAAVTFNVAAGTTYTENCPAITTNGTSTATITFQRSGGSTNPIIYAGTGNGSADAILTFGGCDYITFDGIDLREAAGNSTAITKAEYGLYVRNASATNGAKNNTFKNSKIILDRSNTNIPVGIRQFSAISPSADTGSNSYNKFQSVSIENACWGIHLSGHSIYFDIGNEISNCTIGGTTSNDVGNFTSGSAYVYGAYSNNQKDFKFNNNEIRNVTSNCATADAYAACFSGLTGEALIYNNKIHDISFLPAITTTGYWTTGLFLQLNPSEANTAKVYNNMIYNLFHGYTGATTNTAVMWGIKLGASSINSTYNIDFNSVRITGPVNASSICFLNSNSTANVVKVRNNIFANMTEAQVNARHYCWNSSGTTFGAAGSVSNRNILYISNTTNGCVGYVNTADCVTLGDWISATSQDTESKILHPRFGDTDLHIDPAEPTPVEGNAGYFGGAITWVNSDFDNETRDPVNPDIGADEGTFMPENVVEPLSAFSAEPFIGNQMNLAATANANNDDIMVVWATDNVFGTPVGNVNYIAGNSVLGGGTVLYVGQSDLLPNHPGLIEGTAYYYRAWSWIPNGVNRIYSAVYRAANATIPVSSYPYNEGFETGYTHANVLAGHYTQAQVSGSNYWSANNLFTDYNRTPRTGSWNAFLRYSNDTWLFHQFQFNSGQTYSFRMYARQDMADTSYAFIKVAYGTANNASSMTNTIVNRAPLTLGDYQIISGQFTPTITGSYYVGIFGRMNVTPFYISIDDIQISEVEPFPLAPTDPSPALAATGQPITTDLGWTNNGTVTRVDVYFSTDSLQVVNKNSSVRVAFNQTSSLNSFDLPVLSYNTRYFWKVVCKNDGIDAADSPLWKFTTMTDPTIYSLPYTENFNGVTVPTLPNYWSYSDGYSDAVCWKTATTTPDNALKIGWHATNPLDDWVFTPPIHLASGISYDISFDNRAQSTSFFENLELCAGTEANAASMASPALWQRLSFNGATYQTDKISFIPATTGNYYLGWHAFSIADQYGMYLDNIIVSRTPEYHITPAGYDFGSVSCGDSLSMNYTISNTGEGTLLINAVSLTGNADFTLYDVPALPYSLDHNTTMNFSVSFKPNETGARSAILHITESTNLSEHTYDISGNGISSTISAVPNPMTPTVQQSTITLIPLMIYNTGLGRLDFEVGTPTNDWLSLIPQFGSIASGDSLQANIALNSYGLEPSAISGTLTLFTNDFENPNYPINVYPTITWAPIAANFSADPLSGHAPLEVNFIDSSHIGPQLPGATVSVWQWDFQNDGIIDSYEQNPSFIYNLPGVYSVKLTAISSNGMSSTIVKTNYISATNQSPIILDPISPIFMMEDVAYGPVNLHTYFSDPDSDPLTFTATGSAHITVHLNGNSFTLIPVHNWTGEETVTFTATDPLGWSVSFTLPVTVNPSNDPPVFNPPERFYFLKTTTYTVNFGDYITDPDTPDAQIYILIANASPTQQIIANYTPGVPGVLTCSFSAPPSFVGFEDFNIIINDNISRTITESTFRVEVINQLVPQVTISTTSGYTGQQVQFNDTTLGNPNQWTWNFGDNTATSSLRNPIHAYQTPGIHYVRLTISNTTAQIAPVSTDLIAISMAGILAPTDISGTNNWQQLEGQNEYNVFANVVIHPDGVLNISPNIHVNIFDTTSVNVSGAINASHVTFHPMNIDAWGGLRFNGSANTSLITNCTIQNALNPVVIDNGNVQFINSTIQSYFNQGTLIIGTGVQILGDSSPSLNNIGISNYATGILIDGTTNRNRSTPTLTNIRISNSGLPARDRTDKTAVDVRGEVSPVIDNLEIIDFDYGITFDNSSSLITTTPSIHGVRIVNEPLSTSAGLVGLSIMGNVQVTLDSLYIDNYDTGLIYQDYTPSSRTTPTLTNIRVRNSTNASRGTDVGVVFDNVKEVQFTNSDIDSMSTGIRILCSASSTTSTPTLTNIRVRNSTNASRAVDTGIEISGYVSPQFNDVLIENYIQGLTYTGTGTSFRTTTPTLTNIRVRNSTNASRATSIGVTLKDVVNVIATNDTIDGYTLGMEITNDIGRTTSTPTLTNIRVRNSTNASRQDDTAIYLGENVAGSLTNCLIEEAKTGVFLADGNSTELTYNLFKNCGIGYQASGYNLPQPIKNNIFKLETAWQSAHTWTFVPISIQYTGPWSIHNNTIWGYNKALTASNVSFNFTNNIVWDDANIVAPFDSINSDILYTYNDIRMTGGFPTGSGNFNADPLLVNPTTNDFHLTYNSPCIDAGSPLSSHDPDSTVTDVGAFYYLHKASFTPVTVSGPVGTEVSFVNTSLGHDDSGTVVAWDLNNDGTVEATTSNWNYQFDTPGIYDLKLTMTTGALVDTFLCADAFVIGSSQLKAPQNVTISNLGDDINLGWSAITETIDDLPSHADYYIVYKSALPEGEFVYQNYIEAAETAFTDEDATLDTEGFYFIVGFAGTLPDLIDYIAAHGSYP